MTDSRFLSSAGSQSQQRQQIFYYIFGTQMLFLSRYSQNFLLQVIERCWYLIGLKPLFL